MLSFIKCAINIMKGVNAILEPWSHADFERNGWMSLFSSGPGQCALIEPDKIGHIFE
jgi:hypothetical protein